MASGPLPPGGTQTGLKLFVYAVGKQAALGAAAQELSFLAQLVLINETGAVNVTVKTDSSTLPPAVAATHFVSLVLSSMQSFL